MDTDFRSDPVQHQHGCTLTHHFHWLRLESTNWFNFPPCQKSIFILSLLFLPQTDKLRPNRDTVFFSDGVRRIDFVLSYVDDKDGEKKQVSVPQEWRAAFSHLLSSFTAWRVWRRHCYTMCNQNRNTCHSREEVRPKRGRFHSYKWPETIDEINRFK